MAHALTWRVADVAAVRTETATARTLMVDVPGWPGHLPGQHVDLRLTAEDGYQAERSYSIASAPEDERLELRGPIGGYFVWELRMGGPLFLLAGGSGIVPLRSILRHRTASGSDVPVR